MTKPQRTKQPQHETPRQTRTDGWMNVLTGMGTGRDSRAGTRFRRYRRAQEELEELWLGDDMAARIVELVPGEMLRQGFEVRLSDADSPSEAQRTSKRLHAQLDDLGAKKALRDALCYERAYGGGAIFVGANDGQDPSQPLRLSSLRSVDWLTTLTPRELQAWRYYEDPRAPKYGEPELYALYPLMGGANVAGVYVHESRVLRFGGIFTSRRQVYENGSWGESVLSRVHAALVSFSTAWESTPPLLKDFAQGVFKIKGLASLIASNGEQKVKDRIMLIDLMRSTLRAVLLDDTETFERVTTPLTGLPELLDKWCLRLAAAAGMPVSLLMGQAPAGLNATGASDIRFFYDHVRGLQSDKLKPALERLVKLLLLARQGPTKGQEPESWEVVFSSLWQPSELEQAQARAAQASADAAYVQAGVLSADEVARSRFGGSVYSFETSLDLDARSLLRDATPTPEDEPDERATRDRHSGLPGVSGETPAGEASGPSSRRPSPSELKGNGDA
jgi:hypothetical protein